MIEKIRQSLIIKYTCIIAVIMVLCLTIGYSSYYYSSRKMLHNGLESYLSEEIWEAKETYGKASDGIETNKFHADIKSIHNFSYWLVNKKVIRSQRPADDTINSQIEKRLTQKKYVSGKIYHENMKSHKKKWYFLLLKKDVKLSPTQMGEVFVLANYTPVRESSKIYLNVAAISLIVIVFLSYIIGKFIASRSMGYIEQSFVKQKQFVSDAAHELRTPLAILNSYIELLEYNHDNSQALAEAKEEIQQMSDMVNRLLEIARYGNNTVKKHLEPFLINKLTDSAVCSFSTLYPNVSFNVSGTKTDIEIFADKVMLRQLLSILLDNAVKYTPDNPKISISLEKSSSSTIRLTVSDNGTGISQSDLKHIFDRFWRAEKSRHQKGLGLGLSLAEVIVNIHKGKIFVQSTLGEGTSFIIEIPIAKKSRYFMS